MRNLQEIKAIATKEFENVQERLKTCDTTEYGMLINYSQDLKKISKLEAKEMTPEVANNIKHYMPEFYYPFDFRDSHDFEKQIEQLSNEQLDTLLKDDIFLNLVVTSPDRHVLSNFLNMIDYRQIDLEKYSYFMKNDESFNITSELKTLKDDLNYNYHYLRTSDNSRVEIGDKLNYCTLIKSDIIKNNVFTSELALDTIADPKDERDMWLLQSATSLPELSFMVALKKCKECNRDTDYLIDTRIQSLDSKLAHELQSKSNGKSR